jgi:hypothetical protein
MDRQKLEEYCQAVFDLQDVAKELRRGSPDLDEAHDVYLKAKERCEKARAALFDSEG